MRMRKLGFGQSVVFCAPPEVDRRIREVGAVSPETTPQTSHIIEWSIHETLSEIDRYIPQWAQQGVDHEQRQKAYAAYSTSSDIEALRNAWRQRESKTLEELYGLDTSSSVDKDHPAFLLPTIRDRLSSLGITKLSSMGFGEEQEREVNQEVEQEREVERPPRIDPMKPHLHQAVKRFIETGSFDSTSQQFIPVVDLTPSVRRRIERAWSGGVYMTRDFSQAIVSSGSQSLLDFLRPINWVVSGMSDGKRSPVFVIVSPYEINELLPMVRESRFSRLHMFNPRVTEWMKSFSDLSFYTVSGAARNSFPHPSMEIQSQLTLISGQVYLDNAEMYREVERLLNIRRLVEDDLTQIECSGPILEYFKELVSSRRKGMGYRETHVGKILHLRPLEEDGFN